MYVGIYPHVHVVTKCEAVLKLLEPPPHTHTLTPPHLSTSFG